MQAIGSRTLSLVQVQLECFVLCLLLFFVVVVVVVVVAWLEGQTSR